MSCVNVTIGLVNLEEQDFRLPGYLPFVLTRSYRSNATFAGIFGYGWGCNLTEEIRVRGDQLELRNDEGRTVKLLHPGPDMSVENAIEDFRLDVDSSTSGNGTVFRVHKGRFCKSYKQFDGDKVYRLFRREDHHGNALTYDIKDGLIRQIQDAFQRKLLLYYDYDERLAELQLVTNVQLGTTQTLLKYEYDQRNNLAAVHQPGAPSRYYEYDDHLLVRYRDQRGVVHCNQYDDQRRCVRTWRGDGAFQRVYFYDSKRLQTRVQDAIGGTRLYRYNKNNLITETVDPAGGTSRFEYDDSNKIVLAEDQNGRSTFMVYEPMKGVATKARGDGSMTEFKYDDEGRLVEFVNPLGGSYQTEYSKDGDVICQRSPSGAEITFEYDEHGATTSISFPNGAQVDRKCAKNFIKAHDRYGLISERTFDELSRCTQIKYGDGSTLEYEFDQAGRMIRETGVGGGVQEFAYDAQGRVQKHISERGDVTTYEYNEVGLRTSTRSSDGKVEFAYDDEGRLTSITNERGEVHQIAYDLRGKMVSQTFFDGRHETYEYDAGGAPTRINDSLGRFIDYETDVMGRPVHVRFDDGTILEYEYTPLGNLALCRRNGHEVAFQYDAEGRIVSEQQDDFEITYNYDLMGHQTRVSDSLGCVCEYQRDARQRVEKLTVFATDAVATTPDVELAFEYDELDAITSIKSTKGTSLLRKNNAWGRPVRQVLQSGGHMLWDETNVYDSGAQLTESKNPHGTEQFQYSPQGQILSRTQDRQEMESYSYDSTSNLTSIKDNLGRRTLAYGAGNRLETCGEAKYSYNEAGLMVAKTVGGETTQYRYSSDDLLIEVIHPDGQSTKYEYDALRRRHTKRTKSAITRFRWNGTTLWSEERAKLDEFGRASAPVTTNFVYEPARWTLFAIVGNGSTFFVSSDAVDCPRILVDEASGEIAWKLEKNAWGAAIQDTKERTDDSLDCPIRFPGQYYDEETGLCYNLNRYYDPSTGRYTTPDPIGLLGGLNLYTYTVNPVNYIDPLGLECQNYPPGQPPTLYRGDDRDPKNICNNGFQPRDASATFEGKPISIQRHVGGDTRAWVSTTYDVDTAADFSSEYIYIIDNPGCGVEVDCDPGQQAFEKWQEEEHGIPPDSEFEFAFKNIPPSAVTGYWQNGPGGWTQHSC